MPSWWPAWDLSVFDEGVQKDIMLQDLHSLSVGHGAELQSYQIWSVIFSSGLKEGSAMIKGKSYSLIITPFYSFLFWEKNLGGRHLYL